MKAISLWQPWASFIASGRKRIETRSWSTQYRGPILIHAAKRVNKKEQLEILECGPIRRALGVSTFQSDPAPGLEVLRSLPYGALIAQANLIDCKSTDEIDFDQYSAIEVWLGDFSVGRYGWILEDVKAFEPVPYKGAQGFFDVPECFYKGVNYIEEPLGSWAETMRIYEEERKAITADLQEILKGNNIQATNRG